MSMEQPKLESRVETNPILGSTEKIPADPLQASGKQSLWMMLEAKNEFPPNIQRLIEKKANQEKIGRKAAELFTKVRSWWWLKKFGVVFEFRKLKSGKRRTDAHAKFFKKYSWLLEENPFEKMTALVEIKPAKKGGKSQITYAKQSLMQKLAQSIKNLDLGEPVDEFRDESRRVLYYDEDKEQYYVLENDLPKYLGVEDIKSDFAWGIRYVPDGEMTGPAYRRVTKQILTNEARRELEALHDRELMRMPSWQRTEGGEDAAVAAKPSLKAIEWRWRHHKNKGTVHGQLAEIMAREQVARMSESFEPSLKVERANSLEDGEYKIDFKVRTVQHRRGVSVGEEEKLESVIRRVGIQFTIGKHGQRKTDKILTVKAKWVGKLPVDDIVLIKIRTSEFGDAYARWLKKGKPSGGPEQFLSEDLKRQLLEMVTEGLFQKEEKTGLTP